MKSYLLFGISLAERAGSIMLKYFNTGLKRDWKADNTPVTIADIEVNRLVIESVLKEYPTHGILGEEESFMQESEYVWVCDPIDGTYPFSHGIPTFTFSLALTHQGIPIVSVIYDPVLKRMFAAEKGEGTSVNGNPITVSKMTGFDRQFVGLEGRAQSVFNMEEIRRLLHVKGAILPSLGSLTYTCIMIAMGEFSGAVFSSPKAWDCAAVKLIIEEAGGKATDLHGNEQRYDKTLHGFIASNGIIHEQLVEIVGKNLLRK